MIGVYKIQNTINGKCYIGQSVDIHRRWNDHKSAAFNINAECYNQHLYRSIRKYGVEQFDFSVLEECNRDELDAKEKYYIQQFDSFYNGYNQTLGGNSGGAKMPKEHVLGIIHDLETTRMRHQDIADKWGTSKQMVQGINVGRNWHHNRQYPIRPRKAPAKVKPTKQSPRNHGPHFCVDCGKQIRRPAVRCASCQRISARKAVRPSPAILQDMLSQYTFSEIARQFNVTCNAIRKWRKQYNIPSHAADYNPPRPKPTPPHTTRMVQMCDHNGAPLKTFPSASAAAFELNGKAKTIREVCQGQRKTAYGYKWQYIT